MFQIRLEKPKKDNKFYIPTSNGGLNPGIAGPPTVRFELFRNCVFYVLGRFAEAWGIWLKSVNAEKFIEVARSPEYDLKVGKTPKVGSIAVWEGIGSAAGHVAFVEIVNSNNIVTSESGWSANKDFWTQTRVNDGNWGQNKSKYKFLGFIYPPVEVEDTTTMCVIKEGSVRGEVRQLQQKLTKLGYFKDTVDGIFGIITLGAVLAFQFKNNLEVDGVVGPKTWKALGVNSK